MIFLMKSVIYIYNGITEGFSSSNLTKFTIYPFLFYFMNNKFLIVLSGIVAFWGLYTTPRFLRKL